MLKMPTQE